MLTEISEDLRKVFLCGIGAIAKTSEKSKILIEELVERGELTLEQGRILNEELKHNVKETVNNSAQSVKKDAENTVDAVASNLDLMTEEELEHLKKIIAEREAEKIKEKEMKKAKQEQEINKDNQ